MVQASWQGRNAARRWNLSQPSTTTCRRCTSTPDAGTHGLGLFYSGHRRSPVFELILQRRAGLKAMADKAVAHFGRIGPPSMRSLA